MVQPPASRTLEIELDPPTRPVLAAAARHAWVGESVAAAGAAWLPVAEELT